MGIISFEGLDSSGKSSLCSRMSKALVLPTIRFPGATVVGEDIREMLLNPASHFGRDAAFLGFLFDMVHTQTVFDLSKKHRMYLCDRGPWSTVIYQILTNSGWSAKRKTQAIKFMQEFVIFPELTVILDVDYENMLQRIQYEEFLGVPDAYENVTELEFTRRRKHYLSLPKKFPGHSFVVLDTSGMSKDEVFFTIHPILDQYLKDSAGF